MKKRLLFFSFFLVLIVVSCKKNTSTVLDLKHDYFPLEYGVFWEYEVTEIFHDQALLKHDTIHYQLKTQIGDTVIDDSGRINRKYNRYIRETSADSWVLKDVWTAILVDNRAEIVEENKRKIKLVFSPTADKMWDINQFNTGGEIIAKYDSIDVARKMNNLSFEKTLVAREKKYKTLIDHLEHFEIYAKGVGMIFKQRKDLKFNFGETIPTQGTELYYRISRYGVE